MAYEMKMPREDAAPPALREAVTVSYIEADGLKIPQRIWDIATGNEVREVAWWRGWARGRASRHAVPCPVNRASQRPLVPRACQWICRDADACHWLTASGGPLTASWARARGAGRGTRGFPVVQTLVPDHGGRRQAEFRRRSTDCVASGAPQRTREESQRRRRRQRQRALRTYAFAHVCLPHECARSQNSSQIAVRRGVVDSHGAGMHRSVLGGLLCLFWRLCHRAATLTALSSL